MEKVTKNNEFCGDEEKKQPLKPKRVKKTQVSRGKKGEKC